MSSMDYDYYRCLWCGKTVKAYHGDEEPEDVEYFKLRDLAGHLLDEHPNEWRFFLDLVFSKEEWS